MPTYQYACTDAECGNRFELVQSFTDPAASECPACGSGVRKVFTAVGVVFKGSGFYRTDSRASAAKAANGAEGAGKDSAAGKDSGRSPAGSSSGSSSKSSSSGSGSSSGSSSGKAAARA